MTDMHWKLWRVALRVRSPIHAGYRKLGNMQMTRPYVTGNIVWGTLTAGLTRTLCGVVDGAIYQKMGRQVNACLAFSYFYPSTRRDGVDLWPWEDPDRFGWLHLSSYASTALDYGRFGALEGSLHETEFIRPFTPDGKPVYLVGYVAEDTAVEELPWKRVMHYCQMGAERSYGWGRVEARTEDFHPLQNSPAMFGFPVNLNGKQPQVTLSAKEALRAHALAERLDADGPIEPLVGREWHNSANGDGRGSGQSLKNRGVCYAPGSTVAAGTQLQIGPYGIWETA